MNNMMDGKKKIELIFLAKEISLQFLVLYILYEELKSSFSLKFENHIKRMIFVNAWTYDWLNKHETPSFFNNKVSECLKKIFNKQARNQISPYRFNFHVIIRLLNIIHSILLNK